MKPTNGHAASQLYNHQTLTAPLTWELQLRCGRSLNDPNSSTVDPITVIPAESGAEANASGFADQHKAAFLQNQLE